MQGTKLQILIWLEAPQVGWFRKLLATKKRKSPWTWAWTSVCLQTLINLPVVLALDSKTTAFLLAFTMKSQLKTPSSVTITRTSTWMKVSYFTSLSRTRIWKIVSLQIKPYNSTYLLFTVDQVPIVIYELNESAVNFISQESYEKALILLQKAQTMLDQIQAD